MLKDLNQFEGLSPGEVISRCDFRAECRANQLVRIYTDEIVHITGVCIHDAQKGRHEPYYPLVLEIYNRTFFFFIQPSQVRLSSLTSFIRNAILGASLVLPPFIHRS